MIVRDGVLIEQVIIWWCCTLIGEVTLIKEVIFINEVKLIEEVKLTANIPRVRKYNFSFSLCDNESD